MTFGRDVATGKSTSSSMIVKYACLRPERFTRPRAHAWYFAASSVLRQFCVSMGNHHEKPRPYTRVKYVCLFRGRGSR